MELSGPSLEELFSLEGKVALVIGGDGHLGTPTCEALAEAGARVAIASINLQGSQELAQRLGAQHFGLYLDVADEDMVHKAIDKVVEDAGAIDVLVNMAISGLPRWRIDEVTADDFGAAFRVGVTGYFVASQHAARYMRQAGGGSIINIASMYGLVASYPEVYEDLDSGGQPPYYQAGKAAVLQLTRHLAVYWAKDGIRVNAISPGAFPPVKTQEQIPQLVARLKPRVPLGRLGENWEIKGAILFCASPASSYMTGQNLVIDGGWTAW